ncbi:1,4-dihydroxy-2-naphthoate polyprenyltransferase [Paenibacillus antri]|uniref:1,4-dihydroxy-2-naphthoate polyprenyltransferase n=1 Tax=Paenibacillus antri TaxID=2582848 RepID=A0A5R9G3W7_9BACL|nr:1,4-dihydroxy-2-naphthoate polyprenyltransferase [Paenibacillus antri]TLS49709.1 1,4-dihydroxy-2-naphthoate polyprenyltransferase [Paenibacillus antri]
MTFRGFLKLVEIQTKVASMIPFAIGSLYAGLRFAEFRWASFALMFFSLLCIDMATTAINNYIDYKKAVKKTGYGYEKHNAMVKDRISEGAALTVIAVLFLAAVASGLLLVRETGTVVLLLGALSFAVGILYSFGPIAISRMPLGEIFSGLFMGFLIVFLAAFIHPQDPQLIEIAYAGGMADIRLNLLEASLVFAASIPAVCGVANIMLANNICDMEDDIENKRYTLPIYIGKANAVKLFQALYYVAYLDLIVLYFLDVPIWLLAAALATIVPVRRHAKRFAANPSKAETFRLAVSNFLIMNAARIGVLGVALILNRI